MKRWLSIQEPTHHLFDVIGHYALNISGKMILISYMLLYFFHYVLSLRTETVQI